MLEPRTSVSFTVERTVNQLDLSRNYAVRMLTFEDNRFLRSIRRAISSKSVK